jgi:hypothetical protein
MLSSDFPSAAQPIQHPRNPGAVTISQCHRDQGNRSSRAGIHLRIVAAIPT